MQQIVTFVEKKILKKLAKSKNYRKTRDHCHYTGKYRSAAHSISNLKFNVPNEIPVVFHDGSFSCSFLDGNVSVVTISY